MKPELLLLTSERIELEELRKFATDAKKIAFECGNDFGKMVDAISDRANNAKTLRAIIHNGKALKELGKIFLGEKSKGEVIACFETLGNDAEYRIAACSVLLGEPIQEN